MFVRAILRMAVWKITQSIMLDLSQVQCKATPSLNFDVMVVSIFLA